MSDLGPPPPGTTLDAMTKALTEVAVDALGELYPGKECAVLMAVAVLDGGESYHGDVTGCAPERRGIILAPLALNLMQEVTDVNVEFVDGSAPEPDVRPMQRRRGRHRRRT